MLTCFVYFNDMRPEAVFPMRSRAFADAFARWKQGQGPRPEIPSGAVAERVTDLDLVKPVEAYPDPGAGTPPSFTNPRMPRL